MKRSEMFQRSSLRFACKSLFGFRVIHQHFIQVVFAEDEHIREAFRPNLEINQWSNLVQLLTDRMRAN